MEGLLPEHLAGADLTGAKLPDEIAKFPALDQVAAISSEARKIFIGLLAACVYSWLVIGTTTDVALILNTASSPLPIINTPIPIAGFYVIGATLLAAVYCYFHFYLQRLWRTLATLPAVFPDGTRSTTRPIPGCSPTWSGPTSICGAQLPPPSPDWRTCSRSSSPGGSCRSPCSRLGALSSAHDLGGLGWSRLIGATTFFGRTRFGSPARRCAGRCRCREDAASRPVRPDAGSRDRVRASCPGPRGQIIIWFLLAFLIIFVLSLSASTIPARCRGQSFLLAWRDLGDPCRRSIDAREALELRRHPDLCRLARGEVAQLPRGLGRQDWEQVERVDLRDRNLAFADATSAFLANADLRGAKLTGAQLGFAQLQGADLYGAREAQGRVGLPSSRAPTSSMPSSRAPNLQGAHTLSSALSSSEAQLQGADLRGPAPGRPAPRARRPRRAPPGRPPGSANLQGANLGTAQLQGADLQGAQLQGADLTSCPAPGRQPQRGPAPGRRPEGNDDLACPGRWREMGLGRSAR